MNNIINPIDALGATLISTSVEIGQFLPKVIIAVLVFVIGWVCASILGRVISHIITLTKLDHALNKAGMSEISARAGVKVSVAGFLGGVIKWLIIVAFTLASAEILGLDKVAGLMTDIFNYIPKVIVAAIVLAVAALVADFVARIVGSSVKATGIKADFAASVARWAILIVAGIFPALTQLHIAQNLVEVLFTGIVFAVSLALGLSFGIGGKEAAASLINKMKN